MVENASPPHALCLVWGRLPCRDVLHRQSIHLLLIIVGSRAYVSFGVDTTYDLVGAFLLKFSLHVIVIYCIIP